MIDAQAHRAILARKGLRLIGVKRFSPLIVAAALVALALAALKMTEDKEPPSTWTPVRPS